MNQEYPLNSLALTVKTNDRDTLLSVDFWQRAIDLPHRGLSIEPCGLKSLIIRTFHKAVFITDAENLRELLSEVYDPTNITDSHDFKKVIVVVSPSKSNKLLSDLNNNLLSSYKIPLIEFAMPQIKNEYGKLLKALKLYSEPDDSNPLYRFMYDLSKDIIIALILKFLAF